MSSPLTGAFLAFLGGAVIAGVNYGINLRALREKPSSLASLSTLRQLLSVGYLAAVYLLTPSLPWDLTPLLVGAALGLTIPAILFAFRLSRAHSAAADERGDDTNG